MQDTYSTIMNASKNAFLDLYARTAILTIKFALSVLILQVLQESKLDMGLLYKIRDHIHAPNKCVALPSVIDASSKITPISALSVLLDMFSL